MLVGCHGRSPTIALPKKKKVVEGDFKTFQVGRKTTKICSNVLKHLFAKRHGSSTSLNQGIESHHILRDDCSTACHHIYIYIYIYSSYIYTHMHIYIYIYL